MYGSKSKQMRRRGYRARARVAKIAKGRTTKIQALAQSVRRIQRRMKGEAEYLNYSQNGTQPLVADYNFFCLTSPANWTQVFGSSADDGKENSAYHLSAGMDLRVTLENTINEPDTTGFTCFIVSLKDVIGSAFNPSTGALNLIANTHYTIREGMVLLNKKCFTIHKQKRFTLTNYGQALSVSAAQSQYGTDRRWYWKIRFNKHLLNPSGNWSDLNSGLDPSKTYYVITFNDNSSLDLQNPKLAFNVVHTVKVTA